MKYLKLLQPGFETFTGDFGMIPFENGVSIEPVPRLLADRISASILVTEIDGSEDLSTDQAGISARLVTNNLMSIMLTSLAVATDEDLDEEAKRLAEAAKRVEPEGLDHLTREQLEEIAMKGGIDGLREIAKSWKVKDRSINGLIAEILKAQERDKSANANAERLVSDTAGKPLQTPTEVVNSIQITADPAVVQIVIASEADESQVAPE